MDVKRVTPLILTYNEEANLARTLDRLTWASRVVVVDSFSTDKTVDIARSFENVDVVQREFDDHTRQWNFGLDQVDTEWTLSLDADYVLPDTFADEISRLSPERTLAGYRASFTYCVFGRPLRGSLYPPRILLFRTSVATYVPDGHTQRLSVDGPVDSLDVSVYHDDRKSLDRWLDSQRRYAALEADKLRADDVLGMTDRLRSTRVIAVLLTPFYCLLWQRLLLDGWPGWYYTLQRTYAELLLALELLDRDLRSDS